MHVIVSQAIEQKKLLSFTYDGYFRIVEPHCYGKSSKGNDCLRAFQVDGESSDGKLGWKLYDLSKAANIQLLETAFPSIRDGYRKGDKQMMQIFIEM